MLNHFRIDQLKKPLAVLKTNQKDGKIVYSTFVQMEFREALFKVGKHFIRFINPTINSMGLLVVKI